MAEISIRAADGTRMNFLLGKDRVTIGRSRENDIFLPDQWLSRHHAEIRLRDEGHALLDLGSKNGTLLNGMRLQDEVLLKGGDVITLGEHVLTFVDEALGQGEVEPEAPEPLGTRIYSARELSDILTKPTGDKDELFRQNRVLGILGRAAQELLVHRPLPEIFEKILDLLFEAIPAERGAILLLEGTPPLPLVKASRSLQGSPIARVSRSITRRVVEDRKSLLLPNLLEDASFKAQESILASGIRSAVCAPLWFNSDTGAIDEVIGLVYLDSLKGSHSFGEEDLRILTTLANVAAAKIENVRLLEERLEKRRLEEDMRVAAEIQTRLLPSGAPAVPGYGLVGSNKPCRTVGGDYYDFMLEGGQLLLALGDVAGKGTGAALMMTVLRASVRGHWCEMPCSEAIGRINRIICQNVPDGKYITFFMARLDPATGTLTYVNAGHNPPLLVRADGSLDRLEEGGMVLGMFDSVPYEDGHVEMRPGDVLLIFSDGITETWNAQDEEFGEDGLAKVAVDGRSLGASAMQARVLDELERFAAGAKATDDRTLIVLKRE
jgi:serine phosphatase RsbU (regulator of sigma subunit)